MRESSIIMTLDDFWEIHELTLIIAESLAMLRKHDVLDVEKTEQFLAETCEHIWDECCTYLRPEELEIINNEILRSLNDRNMEG